MDMMPNFADITTTLRNLTNVVSSLAAGVAKAFPVITGTATSATAGAATLPANPVGFIVITLPDGTSARVPYYH